MKNSRPKLDENSTGDDMFAYELINLFAGVMSALNDGAYPIPKHWKEYLDTLMSPPGSRRKPDAIVHKRNVKLTMEAIKEKIAADEGNRRPLLKALPNTPDSKNIHRNLRSGLGDAKLELLRENEMRRQKAKHQRTCKDIDSIKKRINLGAEPISLLSGEYSDESKTALFNFILHGEELKHPPEPIVLSEKDKAIRWMSDGMNLAIAPVHESFGVSIRDNDDCRVLSAFSKKGRSKSKR